MKAKPVVIALSTIVIIALVAVGILGLFSKKAEKELVNENLSLPSSSRYIPVDSDLTLHVKANINDLPDYVESISTTNNKKRLRKEIANFRQGIFALTGLDYESYISQWINNDTSLAIYTNDKGDFGWLIVITTNNPSESDQFLKDFWEKEIEKGKSINTENINEVEIKSYKPDKGKNEFQKIASTSINEIVLIGSDKEMIKKSLITSTNNDWQQLHSRSLSQQLSHLPNGFAFTTISPKGLRTWFDVPEELEKRNDIDGFLGVFSVKGKEIFLDGSFIFKKSELIPDNEINNETSIFYEPSFPIKKLAITSETSKLLDISNKDHISELLNPLIKKSLKEVKSKALESISILNNDIMFFIEEPAGWIVGSRKNTPPKIEINEILTKENFQNSTINYNGQYLNIWSKLITKSNPVYDEISTQLAIILFEGVEMNWWSQNLEALHQLEESNELTALEEISKAANNVPGGNFSQQIFLDSNSTKELLKKWNPWQILQLLNSNSMENYLNIDSLSIGLAHDSYEDASLIALHAQIKIN